MHRTEFFFVTTVLLLITAFSPVEHVQGWTPSFRASGQRPTPNNLPIPVGGRNRQGTQLEAFKESNTRMGVGDIFEVNGYNGVNGSSGSTTAKSATTSVNGADKKEVKQREWDHYSINNGDPYFIFSEDYYTRRSKIDKEGLVETALPFVAPILAFLTFDLVTTAFGEIVELVAQNNWVAVDGGAYQAKIIAPTINGIVIPAISVLFATLTSTTVITLRTRQLDIRQSINTEAGELRAFEYLISSYPPGCELQARCHQYLVQYTSRIIAESQPEPVYPFESFRNTIGAPSPQRAMDSELNGVQRALAHYHDTIPTIILDQSFGCVTRLRQAREKRLTALQSTYPPLHYAILTILASGECTAFLIESNHDLLVFLNAAQMKLLWSMLVGVFTSCFMVFYDLRRPFSGCYQVNEAVDQLYTIRLGLKADAKLSFHQFEKKEKKNGETDPQKV